MTLAQDTAQDCNRSAQEEQQRAVLPGSGRWALGRARTARSGLGHWCKRALFHFAESSTLWTYSLRGGSHKGGQRIGEQAMAGSKHGVTSNGEGDAIADGASVVLSWGGVSPQRGKGHRGATC